MKKANPPAPAKKRSTKPRGGKRPAGARPVLKADAQTKAKGGAKGPADANALIDARIRELGDWRGTTLARVRAIIRRADPGIVEEWKWEVPVWVRDGIICTGETYKSAVKLTFAKGAALDDPSGLFNSSLGGKTRRAIDIREGDTIDEKALTALVRSAAALNAGAAPKRR